MKTSRLVLTLVVLVLALSVSALAQGPGSGPAPPPSSAPPAFDPEAATAQYLASVPADKRAASDAYFEGGYWILLWSFLATVAVNLFLLQTRWSCAMRDRAARVTGVRAVHTFLYWAQYLAATTVLVFPLTVYTGFFREHQYGLATQDFSGWMRDQAVALALALVMGGAFIVALYAVLRRAPRTWWIWGSAVAMAFAAIVLTIGPVYLAPLFNTYKTLEDPRVRDPILSMARANGIMAHTVYEVDASRQSTRISANVSGFLGTERITLNDNLLNRSTLPEVEAVMAHEMGHYVLHHVYEGLGFLALVAVCGFAFVRWAYERIDRRWGRRWGVAGVADVAGLPVLVLLLSVYGFVLTPVQNAFTRTLEAEADVFGLNAARQPDAFATVSLKLAEYRKLAPGPVEEAIFFDHPSGRTRILTAMRWKAEHLRECRDEPEKP
jgi:STE24 endopeptidase